MKRVIEQFIKFGMVGAINTVLTLVIQWMFLALGFHYLIGSIIAFAITVVLAYVLNNIFSFHDVNERVVWSFKAFFKVVTSYSITEFFIANIGLCIWNEVLMINHYISPILNLFITIPINFLLNKFWAYKK